MSKKIKRIRRRNKIPRRFSRLTDGKTHPIKTSTDKDHWSHKVAEEQGSSDSDDSVFRHPDKPVVKKGTRRW